ncbi:FAD/NAD(P)-binding domain-containing protein [Xylariaceae sp. FL0255]|nr:FAD/NAD(P)-binding domain-containing protein [Xylariaceae sp. FL0255]
MNGIIDQERLVDRTGFTSEIAVRFTQFGSWRKKRARPSIIGILKQMTYDSSGVELLYEKADRLSTVLGEINGEAFEANQAADERDGGKSISHEVTLRSFLWWRAAKKIEDDGERNLLISMSEMRGAYVGELVRRQSLRFACWRNVVAEISEPSKKQAKICLSTKVAKIQVLEDDLPGGISAAVYMLKLSQLEKVFITSPSAFWISNESTDDFSSYTIWLAPSYAGDTNPHGWPQEIWNLASFADPKRHTKLVFYLYGDYSGHIVNSMNRKTREGEHEFLRDFFFPYHSRLPGFDSEKAECEPKEILATEWLKDDLCGNGSHYNFQAGIEEADKDVLTFREGCLDWRLWFCGEHAAPFEECGPLRARISPPMTRGKRDERKM